jgi:hypothetical protein
MGKTIRLGTTLTKEHWKQIWAVCPPRGRVRLLLARLQRDGNPPLSSQEAYRIARQSEPLMGWTSKLASMTETLNGLFIDRGLSIRLYFVERGLSVDESHVQLFLVAPRPSLSPRDVPSPPPPSTP